MRREGRGIRAGLLALSGILALGAGSEARAAEDAPSAPTPVSDSPTPIPDPPAPTPIPDPPAPTLMEAAGLRGDAHFLFRHNVLRTPDRRVEDPQLRDDHTELLSRISLNHDSGPLSIGAVLYTGLATPKDLVLLDPDQLDGSTPAGLVDLNRLTLALRQGPLELSAGDVYAVIFRGGLLQISQVPGIDLDVSLRGGALRAFRGPLEARAFAGQVHPQSLTFQQQNLDPALVFPPYSQPEDPSLVREAPGDGLAGAVVEVLGIPGVPIPLSAGVATTALSLDPETTLGAEETPARRVDLQGYGAYLAADPLPGLSLYGEADAFSYRLASVGAPSPFVTLPEARGGGGPLGSLRGMLLYGSALYGAGPVSLLVEAKRSRGNQHMNVRAGGLRGYAFGTPPSLEYERAVVEDNGLTIVSNDVQATHGRVDASLGSALQLRFDALRATDFDLSRGKDAPERILHLYGGLDVYAPSGIHLSLMAGRRRGVTCDAIEAEDAEGPPSPPCRFETDAVGGVLSSYFKQGLKRENDILWHTDGEIAVPLGPLTAAYSTGLVHFTQLGQDVSWFYQWQNALGVQRGERFGLTVYGDLSNNGQFLDVRFDDTGALVNDQASVGQLWLRTDLGGDAFPTRLHYAGELTFSPGWRSELRLFYGSIMGGVRCAGGQCRSLPAFSGAKLSLLYRFG